MTTIVGVRTDRSIVLASDRSVTCGTTRQVGSSKINAIDGGWVAFCGGVPGKARALAWLAKHPGDFAAACRKGNVNCLAVYGGELFDVYTGAEIRVPVGSYATEGSGNAAAFGALAALESRVKSPRERALCALRAAACYDALSAAPYDVLVIWPSRSKMHHYEN